MTCVWNGLIKGLKLKIKPVELLKIVKDKATKTPNILWNGQKLTDQELDENLERIKNIENINQGYDCSTCDPLLFLICHLYNVNIHHKFMNHVMKYEHDTDSNTVLQVESNKGHFWFVK